MRYLVLPLLLAFAACETPSEPATQGVPSSTEEFVVVEDMPQLLPDVETGLRQLQEELVYPEQAKRAGIEGRVFVQFVVTEEGEVTNAEVMRGLSDELNEEALRAVQTLRFEPGTQRGEPVAVKMSLPVVFRLP